MNQYKITFKDKNDKSVSHLFMQARSVEEVMCRVLGAFNAEEEAVTVEIEEL